MEIKPMFYVLEPADPAYDRYCQRLKNDLDLDNDAIEIIVELRNQIMTLQTRLRTLESTLEIYEVRHATRLSRYRENFQDADSDDI